MKGWCPSLARPMPSGDGLLVRVHPPRGRLQAAGLSHLATAARRFGNGIVQVTSRAALQVRGLSEDGAIRFADAMDEAGLAGSSRVVCAPLSGSDPQVDPRMPEWGEQIERALANLELPDKFGVSLDGGGVLPTGDAGCDIVVRGGCIGLAGAADAVATTDPAEMVVRLVEAFRRLALPGMRRMRDLVMRDGSARVFAHAGLVANRTMPQAPGPARVGWLPYARDEAGAFVIGLPFGMTDASTLLDLAHQLPGGAFHLATGRRLALTGPTARHAGTAVRGFITDEADPRRQVVACPGSPRCSAASVPALADARLLAQRSWPGGIHVSGCAKGCASTAAAAVTLVGVSGRYDLVRNGRPGDAPVASGLSLSEAILAAAA